MAVKVVDASALAALVFGEPQAEAIAARLEGHRLVAPTLLPYEMASVCAKKLRRYPEQREAILAALALARRLDVDHVEVGPEELVTVAEESGLTVYDASYLWLAAFLDAELVTLDERLARAAE
jgi:predicted nucleic acid-binding protein